ncbi:MAG: hypothetical protein RR415_03500 [Ruthenibacterium sp.]
MAMLRIALPPTAPYGANTNGYAVLLFRHRKSNQKGAAVPQAADPRAPQGETMAVRNVAAYLQTAS